MTKEFNYEAAKNGAPVQTRDGLKARIICWDAKSTVGSIVALVFCSGEEFIRIYRNDGKYLIDKTSSQDLVMAPEKHEGWVNIYKDGGRRCGSVIWGSEEDAEKNAMRGETYLTTVKIEWTE